MSIDNGGPAFPQKATVARAWAVFENAKGPLSEEEYLALIESLQVGMMLRDYFAAKALPSTIVMCVDDPRGGKDYHEYCAEQSYLMADAMLKARNK